MTQPHSLQTIADEIETTATCELYDQDLALIQSNLNLHAAVVNVLAELEALAMAMEIIGMGPVAQGLDRDVITPLSSALKQAQGKTNGTI
jgi:hypothetical protein